MHLGQICAMVRNVHSHLHRPCACTFHATCTTPCEVPDVKGAMRHRPSACAVLSWCMEYFHRVTTPMAPTATTPMAHSQCFTLSENSLHTQRRRYTCMRIGAASAHLVDACGGHALLKAIHCCGVRVLVRVHSSRDLPLQLHHFLELGCEQRIVLGGACGLPRLEALRLEALLALALLLGQLRLFVVAAFDLFRLSVSALAHKLPWT